MSRTVSQVNRKILRQCREQLALRLDSPPLRKLRWLLAVEEGKKDPTLNQLGKLAELYSVPRWVLVAESLPKEYQLTKAVPAFRSFVNSRSKSFDDYRVRRVVARVGQLRDFVLELREDMEDPIKPFSPPQITHDDTPEQAAKKVRAWLGVTNSQKFLQWKQTLENMGVFVFLTGKYNGWSKVSKEVFRGLSIYHQTLPIVVINDSDATKAQSFTLFHELGHLLHGEHAIDDVGEPNEQMEKWCDRFAGNVLMPADQVRVSAAGIVFDTLKKVKKLAAEFSVSPKACVTRLVQVDIIENVHASSFYAQLQNEYSQRQQKLSESNSSPPRNRPKEVLDQYGRIYSSAVFQAYRNEEIGLSKLCQLLDLKQVSHAMQLESRL